MGRSYFGRGGEGGGWEGEGKWGSRWDQSTVEVSMCLAIDIRREYQRSHGSTLDPSECAPQPLHVADLPLLVIQLSFVSSFSVTLCLYTHCLLSIASICNKYIRKHGGRGYENFFDCQLPIKN